MSSLFKKVWGTSNASADKRGGRQGQGAASNQTINSIEQLDQKEQHLEKRRAVIEQKIAEELEKAKKYNKENKKSQALMCLKKKKMHEKNMDDLGNLIMKVNEQKMLLENAQTTAQTLKALEDAAKASKSVLKENKIDDVDKLLEDIATDADTMKDINERIAEPSLVADYDEDELLGELEELDAQMLDNELLMPAVAGAQKSDAVELPSVPETKVATEPEAQRMTSEEAELAKLEAELAS